MGTVLTMPIAHGEGNFYAPPEELAASRARARSCSATRRGTAASTPAANVNGSARAIAGVCNAARNVVGLMPHPERAREPELGSAGGRLVFEALIRSAAAR